MFKILLLALVGLASAGIFSSNPDLNWNGYLDTANIDSNMGTSKLYTKAFPLNGFEALRVSVLCKDTTTEAGEIDTIVVGTDTTYDTARIMPFSDDSVKFSWGYRTFTKCINGVDAVDTCMGVEYIVDTVSADSFGKVLPSSLSSATPIYTEISTSRKIDTLFCSGFAVQSKTIYPSPDTYIQFWVQGISGNLTGAPVKTRFSLSRKVYGSVRNK